MPMKGHAETPQRLKDSQQKNIPLSRDFRWFAWIDFSCLWSNDHQQNYTLSKDPTPSPYSHCTEVNIRLEVEQASQLLVLCGSELWLNVFAPQPNHNIVFFCAQLCAYLSSTYELKVSQFIPFNSQALRNFRLIIIVNMHKSSSTHWKANKSKSRRNTCDWK